MKKVLGKWNNGMNDNLIIKCEHWEKNKSTNVVTTIFSQEIKKTMSVI